MKGGVKRREQESVKMSGWNLKQLICGNYNSDIIYIIF